jgi:hypothetical protein
MKLFPSCSKIRNSRIARCSNYGAKRAFRIQKKGARYKSRLIISDLSKGQDCRICYSNFEKPLHLYMYVVVIATVNN